MIPNLTQYLNKILQGDVLERLRHLPSNSVDCVVTSPPYWALRDYKLPPTQWPEVKYKLFGFEIVVPAMECCLGLEKTPEAFIGHLVLVFEEVRRVLKPTGVCWVNMGDTYVATAPGTNSAPLKREGVLSGVSEQTSISRVIKRNKTPEGLKPKDLVGIPWMLAFALRGAGWYLRQDIIWAKRSCMPESVTDRCTKSHEYIFQLTKSQKYYFDNEAIKTPVTEQFANDSRWLTGPTDKNMKLGYNEAKAQNPKQVHRMFSKSGNKQRKTSAERGCPEGTGKNQAGSVPWEGMTANRRSVWHISPSSFKEAHFATFPTDIPELCIKAGSSEYGCCSECDKPWKRILEKQKGNPEHFNGSSFTKGKTLTAAEQNAKVGTGERTTTTTTTGWQPTCKCRLATDLQVPGVVPSVILDPFSGSGTTFMVAKKLNRSAIGIELNPGYVVMAERRLKKELGMFYKTIHETV